MAAPLNKNTKGVILLQTSELLKTKPFSEITLADIAAQSGISKGTLYYYYSSKDDILFDIADLHLNMLSDSLLQWAGNRQKDTSLPRLLKYTLERGVFNESGGLRLYLIGAAVSGHEQLRQRLIEKYKYFRDTLAGLIKERCRDSDGVFEAWLLLTVMDGLLVQIQLGNENFDAEDFIAKTAAMLCKNI